MMKKILSKKKKVHLLRNGYRFRKDKIMKDGDTAWRCIIRRMCCGRLRLGVTDDVIYSTEHNHEPEIVRNETRKDELTVEQPRQLFQQTSTTTPLLSVTSFFFFSCRLELIPRRRGVGHSDPLPPQVSSPGVIWFQVEKFQGLLNHVHPSLLLPSSAAKSLYF